MNELHRAKEILAALPAIPLAQSLGVHTEVFYEGECYLCKIWFGTNPNRKPLPVHDKFVLDVAALPVLETPAEAVFCDHSQWRECAATLEMVRDLSDKALNYTAAYDLANDLAAILAGYDDAIPGAPVEPVPPSKKWHCCCGAMNHEGTTRDFAAGEDHVWRHRQGTCERICDTAFQVNDNLFRCTQGYGHDAVCGSSDEPFASAPVPAPRLECVCPRFRDTGGYRIADLTCPIHGVNGTEPGDGYWEDSELSPPVGTQE
jgi:hypothetical protein